MPSLKDVVSDLTPFLIDVRRHFHAYPELSGQEFESAKTIRHHLTEAGIHWARCGMETATVAVIEGKGPGKTVLLRADMDALPVTETSGLPYASCRQGIMHACGHDCHMAMLLTCAKVLEATKDQWSGTVKLAFQPAEESGEGALAASNPQNGTVFLSKRYGLRRSHLLAPLHRLSWLHLTSGGGISQWRP